MVVGVTVVVGQACVPDCTDCTPGDLVADPTNCQNYYLCLADCQPSDVPFSCDAGFMFDNSTSECIEEDSVDLDCGVCPPDCRFACDPSVELSFFADYKLCNKYYLCNGEQVTPLTCPTETPYFDGDQCQDDQSLCCDWCSPYCFDAFVEIADPTNCNNFYVCKQAGYYPGPDDLFSCPTGEKFDGALGHCSSDALCDQPCA